MYARPLARNVASRTGMTYAEAKAAVLNGRVTVDGRTMTEPTVDVPACAVVDVRDVLTYAV